MKKHYILGFLLLLTFTIGMFSSGVYAAEPIDTDGDGVPDSVDFCPNLLEDYDPQYGNDIDGCPADFFHGMMLTLMEYKIIQIIVQL